MPPIAQALALVAAMLHVGFFYLESIAFRRPQTWARFGLASQEQADVVRPMAFNQGFYNLFLALGVIGGLVLIDFASGGAVSAGIGITKFALASMVLAGGVLLASGRRFRRAALLQALPPALALLASALI
jgi:putative membrane protein